MEVEVATAPAGSAPQQYDTKTATEFWDGQGAAYESRPFYTETGGYFRWCLDLALQSDDEQLAKSLARNGYHPLTAASASSPSAGTLQIITPLYLFIYFIWGFICLFVYYLFILT